VRHFVNYFPGEAFAKLLTTNLRLKLRMWLANSDKLTLKIMMAIIIIIVSKVPK